MKSLRIYKPAGLLLIALATTIPGLAAPKSATGQPADSKELREAQAVLAGLAKKHRAAPVFSLVFESRAEGADGNLMPAAKGSLTAADSGRFRLQHAQGTVVSDGRTVWQYFPSTKQVVIKDAADAGEAGGVLLRFLQARALRAAPRPGGLLRVVLDPASVGESLDSLVVTLSPAESSVRRVLTQDPAGNRVEYTLKSLRYDARPGRNAFVFKLPAGVEVIDMR
ncbi:MAG: outer rane lipoprotein carrier protein LolA [Fibrobacteria bacterium]|jgi:outer membrane lipoprotein-sorting protein|nr:outer rane lipoprotein carrier protein LolA [Fibrobacteria bacterium]